MEKPVRKLLTKEEWCGILSELSARAAGTEARKSGQRKMSKTSKIVVDKMADMC